MSYDNYKIDLINGLGKIKSKRELSQRKKITFAKIAFAKRILALRKRELTTKRRSARSFKDFSRDTTHLIPQEWYDEFVKFDTSYQDEFLRKQKEQEHSEFMRLWDRLESRGLSYWRMYEADD